MWWPVHEQEPDGQTCHDEKNTAIYCLMEAAPNKPVRNESRDAPRNRATPKPPPADLPLALPTKNLSIPADKPLYEPTTTIAPGEGVPNDAPLLPVINYDQLPPLDLPAPPPVESSTQGSLNKPRSLISILASTATTTTHTASSQTTHSAYKGSSTSIPSKLGGLQPAIPSMTWNDFKLLDSEHSVIESWHIVDDNEVPSRSNKALKKSKASLLAKLGNSEPSSVTSSSILNIGRMKIDVPVIPPPLEEPVADDMGQLDKIDTSTEDLSPFTQPRHSTYPSRTWSSITLASTTVTSNSNIEFGVASPAPVQEEFKSLDQRLDQPTPLNRVSSDSSTVLDSQSRFSQISNTVKNANSFPSSPLPNLSSTLKPDAPVILNFTTSLSSSEHTLQTAMPQTSSQHGVLLTNTGVNSAATNVTDASTEKNTWATNAASANDDNKKNKTFFTGLLPDVELTTTDKTLADTSTMRLQTSTDKSPVLGTTSDQAGDTSPTSQSEGQSEFFHSSVPTVYNSSHSDSNLYTSVSFKHNTPEQNNQTSNVWKDNSPDLMVSTSESPELSEGDAGSTLVNERTDATKMRTSTDTSTVLGKTSSEITTPTPSTTKESSSPSPTSDPHRSTFTGTPTTKSTTPTPSATKEGSSTSKVYDLNLSTVAGKPISESTTPTPSENQEGSSPSQTSDLHLSTVAGIPTTESTTPTPSPTKQGSSPSQTSSDQHHSTVTGIPTSEDTKPSHTRSAKTSTQPTMSEHITPVLINISTPSDAKETSLSDKDHLGPTMSEQSTPALMNISTPSDAKGTSESDKNNLLPSQHAGNTVWCPSMSNPLAL